MGWTDSLDAFVGYVVRPDGGIVAFSLVAANDNAVVRFTACPNRVSFREGGRKEDESERGS